MILQPWVHHHARDTTCAFRTGSTNQPDLRFRHDVTAMTTPSLRPARQKSSSPSTRYRTFLDLLVQKEAAACAPLTPGKTQRQPGILLAGDGSTQPSALFPRWRWCSTDVVCRTSARILLPSPICDLEKPHFCDSSPKCSGTHTQKGPETAGADHDNLSCDATDAPVY